MAALSRPSLRSSARKNADRELHAIDSQMPSTTTPRGKRTRDSSLGNESNASSKKFKPDPPPSTRPKAVPKPQAQKSLPIRDRPNTKYAVTHVVRSCKPDPVPVRGSPNGSMVATTTLNGHSIDAKIAEPAHNVHQVDKRSLRSHDGGSRSKSELAQYFPNYEEIISVELKEPGMPIFHPRNVLAIRADMEFLGFPTPETLIYISDEPTKSTNGSKVPTTLHKGRGRGRPPSGSQNSIEQKSREVMEWGEETFTTLNDATKLDFSAVELHKKHTKKDPMDDATYLKVHRKAERQEKQLRNIEKERAMHEKVQLERLLDGLRGHDWLRVMGISGITDGEKKAFEPKRDYLIGEVRILLEKFRLWKEEEKRRKVQKEEDDDDEEEEEDEDGEEASEDEEEEDNNRSALPPPKGTVSFNGDPPDYNDVDASAARQLHQEAILATQLPLNRKRTLTLSQPSPVSKRSTTIPTAVKPFTSFYSKPYLRAAAINKHRRGRSKTAFGQPLVEPAERDFVLPDEVFSDEAVRESERRRRRWRRDSGGA